MFLVSEQDIINTYSKNEQNSCKKYTEYLQLIKSNPSFGYKRCAKLLDIPAGRTRWWHTKGKKKATPNAFKTVEKLKQNNLLPFNSEHKHAETIFRMLGMLYGDGCVDRNLNTLSFISSVKKNIDLWEKDLIELFPFLNGKLNLIEVGEYGHAFSLRTCDRAVIRFFTALGTPIGDKVIVPYSFPKKFDSLGRNSILAFFDGLFSAEISVPRFHARTRCKSYFKNFSFSLSKDQVLEESHIEFMKQIMLYMKKLGIQCTNYVGKSNYKNSFRKDGKKSFGYRIFFRTNIKNVQKSHKIFPLKYCVEKKQKFDKELELCFI
ncbi:MAG: hypothetical protein ABIH20_05380 [Candidatus Diapherotrites archaeon]